MRTPAQLAEHSARIAALARRREGERQIVGGGGGATAAAQIKLARLMYWYEPGDDPAYPTKATAWYGYLVAKIGESFEDVPPPPIDEMLLIWPWIYPPITPIGTPANLKYTLPGIPLGQEYVSDVPVAFFKERGVPEEEGAGKWRVIWPFIGVCVR